MYSHFPDIFSTDPTESPLSTHLSLFHTHSISNVFSPILPSLIVHSYLIQMSSYCFAPSPRCTLFHFNPSHYPIHPSSTLPLFISILSISIPTHTHYRHTNTHQIICLSYTLSVLTPGWIPLSEIFSAYSTNSPLFTFSFPLVPRIVCNLLRVSVSLFEHPHNHHHPLSIPFTTHIIPMNNAQ